MPLYETIFLVNARAPLSTVAHVLKQKAQCVFEHGGVVRRLENLGIMPLAYPMYRNRKKHYKGRWVMMLFDSSAKCQQRVTDLIRTDTEVIRWSVAKENNVFRDKYDELRIHGGAYRGEIDSTKIDAERMDDLDESIDLQRLLSTDRFDWEQSKSASNSAVNAATTPATSSSSDSVEAFSTEGLDDRVSPLEALFADFQKSK